MDNIVDIDDFRPHILIVHNDKSHIVPVELMDSIISGKTNPQALDKELLIAIIANYMDLVKTYC